MAVHSSRPSAAYFRYSPGSPLSSGHSMFDTVAGCQVPGTFKWTPNPSTPAQKTITDAPFTGTQKWASIPLVLLPDRTCTVSIMSTSIALPVSMSGVDPAFRALLIGPLCAATTALSAAARSRLVTMSSSSGLTLSNWLSSLSSFVVFSQPSIDSSTLIRASFRCSSLASSICCTLFRFFGTLTVGCDSHFHCCRAAFVFRALSSGRLSIQASLFSLRSDHIFSAVFAHLLAACIIRLCTCGLNSLPILSSMSLGTAPAAVHSLFQPTYLLLNHEISFQSPHSFRSHSMVSSASSLSHRSCAHAHPHTACSVDSSCS